MAIFGSNRPTLGRSKGAIRKRLRSFPTRISITISGVARRLQLQQNQLSNDYVAYYSDLSGSYAFECYFGADTPYAAVYALSQTYEHPLPLTLPNLTTLPFTGWSSPVTTFVEATPTILSLSMPTNLSAVYTGGYPSFKASVTSTPAGPSSGNYYEYNLSAYEAGAGTGTIAINNEVYDGAPVNFSYTITKKPVTLTLTNSTTVSYGSFALPENSAASSLYSYSSVFHQFNTLTDTGGITNFLTGYPTRSSLPGTYTVSFNPSYVSKNYSITNSPTSVTSTIVKLNQGIAFSPSSFADIGSTQTLSASATSSLPVSFSIVSGPGTITNGNILSYTGGGSVVVRASQGGSSIYNPATNVDRTIAVSVPVDVGIPQRLGTLIGGVAGRSFATKTSPEPVSPDATFTYALKSGETGTWYSYSSPVTSQNTVPLRVILNPKHEIKNSSATIYSSPGYWVSGTLIGTTFSVESTNTSTNAGTFPTSNWTGGFEVAPQYPRDITVSGTFAHVDGGVVQYTGVAPSPRTLKNRSYIPSPINYNNWYSATYISQKYKNLHRNLFTNFEPADPSYLYSIGATQTFMFTPTGFTGSGSSLYFFSETKPLPGPDKWTFFSTASFEGDNSGYYDTNYLAAKSTSQAGVLMPSPAIADFESYRSYPGYETSLSAPISYNYATEVLPNLLTVSGGYYDTQFLDSNTFGAVVNGDIFAFYNYD